ncbi:MAG TPA: RdgB/HAM1 family non-canonical purine NTP pyrophosphatase [Candidatus Binatus sp.]|nr:RdgB/HAM1 family non-canonical purine NTP pyrophosphatase [Candidatus Binatus sp.]
MRRLERLHGGDATSRSDRRPALWLATQNLNKYNEAKAILDLYKIPLRHLKVAKTELQSSQLEDVARYALQQLSGYYGNRFVIVEDSGLFVRSLHGFPGSFSSHVSKTLGLEGVLQLMNNRRDRRAYFKAAIALAGPRTKTRVITGTVQGKIASSSRGTRGFGFDPIFIPNRAKFTFAEASVELKNKYSHRARALKKLAAWYIQEFVK